MLWLCAYHIDIKRSKNARHSLDTRTWQSLLGMLEDNYRIACPGILVLFCANWCVSTQHVYVANGKCYGKVRIVDYIAREPAVSVSFPELITVAFYREGQLGSYMCIDCQKLITVAFCREGQLGSYMCIDCQMRLKSPVNVFNRLIFQVRSTKQVYAFPCTYTLPEPKIHSILLDISEVFMR